MAAVLCAICRDPALCRGECPYDAGIRLQELLEVGWFSTTPAYPLRDHSGRQLACTAEAYGGVCPEQARGKPCSSVLIYDADVDVRASVDKRVVD
jgi:hypothetical protein